MRKKTRPNSEDTENDSISRRNLLGATAVAGGGLVAALLHQWLSNTQGQNSPPQSVDNNSVLIVYLTRTKNTEAVAEIIQQEVGGDMMKVKPVEPYPEDYDAIVAQVDEENESGYTPPLKNNVENMQDYDTVFFGFPTWDMQLPPPMKTFLKECDLSD